MNSLKTRNSPPVPQGGNNTISTQRMVPPDTQNAQGLADPCHRPCTDRQPPPLPRQNRSERRTKYLVVIETVEWSAPMEHSLVPTQSHQDRTLIQVG